MTQPSCPDLSLLTGLPEDERTRALDHFHIIRPFLEDGIPVARLARHEDIPVRTVWRWIEQYRSYGLAGLARKERSDKYQRKISDGLRQLIEGLALRKPQLSVASIHRQVADAAKRMGEASPSYSAVYSVIRDVAPALVTMAHAGTKAYSEQFDLIHRSEAAAPNAIWQADHTQLDLLVKDEHGKSWRPWLTIILGKR